MLRPRTLRLNAILLVLLLSLVTGVSNSAFALAPHDLPQGTLPSDPTVVGVASTGIDCLAAISTGSESIAGQCPASGTVELNWQGDAQQANLVLSVPDPSTAPQAAHQILVNGQPATAMPVCSPMQPCTPGEYFYLNVPLEAVQQGTNRIEIAAEGQTTALALIANVRLKVLGQVAPIRSPFTSTPTTSAKTAATPFVITFQNPMDSTNQQAMAFVPDSYNPSVPAPLVVYAHARSRTMEDGPDSLGPAASSKGWLVVSPQLHGSWPIPPECFHVPNNCDYDDQVLAGTTPSGSPARPGAWAHASRESQYDVVGAAKYMVDHYNVKPDQIYLVGGSMGGQTTGVTAAKFPHLFAAAYTYMGISNLAQWYGELDAFLDRRTLEKECHINGVPQSPTANPFCYQERTSVEFGRNYIHTPISMTHAILDEMVPISHSRNLRTAINSFGPEYPASLYEEPAWLTRQYCTLPYHCLDPDPNAILRYLDGYRLNNNPDNIRIATDESKLFYWMNLTQTGDAHWTYVDVTRDTDSPTVKVTTNDPNQVRVSLNLGTGSRMGEVLLQPGMGLPATTYLLKGAGYFELVDYTSGYLTTRVNTTGSSTFTLSALDVDVTANPAIVPDDQAHTSTITVQVRDSSDQAAPVPDGTPVQLETSKGLFSNLKKTLTLTTVNGQVATILTVQPSDDLATITATVRQASGSATVDVVKLGLGLELTPSSQIAYVNVPFTMTYRVINESEANLSAIKVTDDNGGSDQVTVCEDIVLAPTKSTTCQRQIILPSSTTLHAQAAGQSPAGDPVIGTDSAFIELIAPALSMSVSPWQALVMAGDSVTFRYTLTNSGDVTLNDVAVVGDNGTPYSGDDYPICLPDDMLEGATRYCSHTMTIGKSVTIVATATGLDPLGKEVKVQAQATVIVGGRAYLPYIVNRR